MILNIKFGKSFLMDLTKIHKKSHKKAVEKEEKQKTN